VRELQRSGRSTSLPGTFGKSLVLTVAYGSFDVSPNRSTGLTGLRRWHN